jgi:hypothetical protein
MKDHEIERISYLKKVAHGGGLLYRERRYSHPSDVEYTEFNPATFITQVLRRTSPSWEEIMPPIYRKSNTHDSKSAPFITRVL